MYSRTFNFIKLNLAGNPLGISSNLDKLPMHPFFSVKDCVTVVGLLLITAYLISFTPNALGQGWPAMKLHCYCAICLNIWDNKTFV